MGGSNGRTREGKGSEGERIRVSEVDRKQRKGEVGRGTAHRKGKEVLTYVREGEGEGGEGGNV